MSVRCTYDLNCTETPEWVVFAVTSPQTGSRVAAAQTTEAEAFRMCRTHLHDWVHGIAACNKGTMAQAEVFRFERPIATTEPVGEPATASRPTLPAPRPALHLVTTRGDTS